jgi:hypothetical protein
MGTQATDTANIPNTLILRSFNEQIIIKKNKQIDEDYEEGAIKR